MLTDNSDNWAMELPQQQKNGPEVFLDLKGTCFLCLKDPASDTARVSTGGGGRVSLREICRYLEINDNELQQNGFAVALCESCVAHFNQLIGLIHEMEDIQRRVAHQLQQFHGILEGSLEGNQSRQQWKKILKKNPITASIVGCLRNEAGDKCQEKIKNLATKADAPVPIHGTSSTASQLTMSATSINSSSIQMNDLDSSNNALIEPITSKAPVPESSSNPPSSKKRSRTDDHEDLPTDNPKKKLESSRDVVMGIFDQNCRTSRDEELLQFECLHCESFVTTWARKMRVHLLADHPDTLFPSTKAPNLSDKMFVDCVKELLKTETEESKVEAKSRKMFKDKNTDHESPLYCIPCGRTYKRGTHYRYHLIVEHYDTLKQKLARLQKDISGGKQLSKFGNVEEFTCAVEEGGCGKIFSRKDNLERHKKESCPNNQVETPWICKTEDGGCGKVFSIKRVLMLHQKHTCPYLKAGKQRSSRIPEEDVDGGPKILKVSGSGSKPSSVQMSEESRESNGFEVMEGFEEDPKGMAGEGGKASETDVSSAFSGNAVKEEVEERSSLEFSEAADSTTADDNLFECDVFVVKSE